MSDQYIYQYWVVGDDDGDVPMVLAGPFNRENDAWGARGANPYYKVVKTKHQILHWCD